MSLHRKWCCSRIGDGRESTRRTPRVPVPLISPGAVVARSIAVDTHGLPSLCAGGRWDPGSRERDEGVRYCGADDSRCSAAAGRARMEANKGKKIRRATPCVFGATRLFWWWAGAELNCRHQDFQSCALPTELPARHGREGLEPEAERETAPREQEGPQVSWRQRTSGNVLKLTAGVKGNGRAARLADRGVAPARALAGRGPAAPRASAIGVASRP